MTIDAFLYFSYQWKLEMWLKRSYFNEWFTAFVLQQLRLILQSIKIIIKTGYQIN